MLKFYLRGGLSDESLDFYCDLLLLFSREDALDTLCNKGIKGQGFLFVAQNQINVI